MSDFCFVDSETMSKASIKGGGYKYHRHRTTDNLVWSWVFNQEAEGGVWSPPWAWGQIQRPDKDPERLIEHAKAGGYLIAWNAAFDRHHWNEVMVRLYGWPATELEQWLCAQALAEANNLPGKLEKAADALGTRYQKDKRGPALIRAMSEDRSRAEWDSTQFETPEMMGHFRSYCLKDSLAMRDVWNLCRDLTLSEWAEYHSSERINDRGIAVDVDFAAAAKDYAEAEFDDLNAELFALTGVERLTVTNHVLKARWLYDQLFPSEELQQLVTKPEKTKGKPRYSADRTTREQLLDLLNQPEYAAAFDDDHRERIIKFIEIIEAGNSAAVRKFSAIVDYEIDGRVHGSYSFNGAGQTGRYSSRGVQVHNLIRSPVEKNNPDRAIDAMEDILDGAAPAMLVDKYGYPVSRLLARLIRPTFIAEGGNTLVWADWDQIEARVLPWLANSKGGDAKLDLFREKQDVYKHAALPIYKLADVSMVSDDQRQVGKVAELALGFGGANGAFAAMGRGYGIVLPEQDVTDIVGAWRKQNAWCVDFWNELWSAALTAYKRPGMWFHAGRVRYLYHPGLMRGTLMCALPDDRLIVYPAFRHELVDRIEKDANGNENRIRRWETTFMRGFGSGSGRLHLWHGTLAENITQGTAASFLRRALCELDDVAILHTHDEVCCEIQSDRADLLAEDMRDTMTYIPPWAEGLPLSVTVESGPYYTK